MRDLTIELIEFIDDEVDDLGSRAAVDYVHTILREGTSCRKQLFFFFSSRRRHTRLTCDWSSDVCSSDLHRKEIHRLKQLLAEKTLEVDFFKGALQKIEARRQKRGGTGERASTSRSEK